MDLDRLMAVGAMRAKELLVVGAIFAVLGLLLRRLPNRAKLDETRTNAVIHVIDLVMVMPLVTAFIAGLSALFVPSPLSALWNSVTVPAVALAVLLVGDLVGYWRHRIQHSALLWPAHAIHHSDRELSWFSLIRMHPIDRLGTALDAVVLAALGFPAWALMLNGLARHYYGYFIHADLPWTFGRFDLVLNSPVMHRWHHSRDIHDKNFATLFSIWDRAFGTYYAPGPCDGPLGVDADMGKGVAGQYLYPFRAWWNGLRKAKTAVEIEP